MTIPNEQLQWFNNLPLIVRKEEGDKYERACVCGSTVWYEFANTENVISWINIHHKHTAADKPERKPFVYDWSIPWKFSLEGMIALKQEFGLKLNDSNRVAMNGPIVEIFADEKGNKFVFVEGDRNIKNPIENHWATFVPESSSVNL